MNDEQLLRYSRQIFLPEMDIQGQLRLLQSHILVIGLGGLGSASLPYLVAAGIGEITLMDDDVVELSNLARQIVHSVKSLNQAKVQSAQQFAHALNAEVKVHTLPQRAKHDWLMQNIHHYDLVLDCSDNAEVRYAINDAALKHKVPWIHGAAIALHGQLSVFDPRISTNPCYRCLYPNIQTEQLNCSESGVLSPLVGVVGTLQAVESLKLLAQIGTSLAGRLLTYDALNGSFREWQIKKKDTCVCCSKEEF